MRDPNDDRDPTKCLRCGRKGEPDDSYCWSCGCPEMVDAYTGKARYHLVEGPWKSASAPVLV